MILISLTTCRGWAPHQQTYDALLIAMRGAIEAVVIADPVRAKATLEGLADHPYASAQLLLYHGLIAGAETYADWACDLLGEGGDRLLVDRCRTRHQRLAVSYRLSFRTSTT